ncbi:MAG: META domain-containing protein [Paludibacteraceae bacterium]|nr:META domain-containing protein [Paludibacteraceae bacterium]
MKQILFILLLLISVQGVSARKVVRKPSTDIKGCKWTLVTLKNNRVGGDSVKFRVQPYIQFLPGENHFSGHGGCNALGGTYEFTPKNHLRLYGIISTKMACLGQVDVEGDFLQALREADHYTVSGKTLTIFDGKGIALAAFEIRETKK